MENIYHLDLDDNRVVISSKKYKSSTILHFGNRNVHVYTIDDYKLSTSFDDVVNFDLIGKTNNLSKNVTNTRPGNTIR